MRAPTSAPTTTRCWPRRRSNRCIGPPRSNTTLTTLPTPPEAKRRDLDLALSASPARRDGSPLSRGLATSRSARTHQPESRQRGIPATARAGRQPRGGGATSTL
jgi:hypothetical protein